MKTLAAATWAFLFAWAAAASAEEASLEQQLESLTLPGNQAPVTVSREDYYSVQARFVPLAKRSELLFGVGKNFNADSYLVDNELSLSYRFHFSDRWSLGASASYVFTDLNTAGKRLLEEHHLLPDAAWAKVRVDLLAAYNLFYGKFRVSMDTVFYFDQYVALGPAATQLNTGWAPGVTADVGFAFWFGKKACVKVGLKDYMYSQKRTASSTFANDLVAHLDAGVLLGGAP